MVEKRLKTYIWVQSQQWRCTQLNLPIYVSHKGEESAGAVIIKIVLPDGRCQIFSQAREADGTPAWQSWSQDKSPVEEGHADDYVGRRLKIDPDLWVLEIEDPKGLYEFDGKIL